MPGETSFTSPLTVEITQKTYNGRVYVKLKKSFEYLIDFNDPAKGSVVVQEGFVTDFASVPRIFWPLFPPLGPWAKAAVIHDWMYKSHKITTPFGDNQITRSQADTLFLDGMRVLGVLPWKAMILYLAVRAFGWVYWNERYSP